jgi:hypothetical protein
VPAILPFGHHIKVTRPPVCSTSPRQMHSLGLRSRLVRAIVSTVWSLSATVSLGASVPAAALASLVSAYSSMEGDGPAMILTPVVALPLLARSTRDCCFCVILKLAGVACKTWSQLAPSSVTSKPCLAADFLTASSLSLGSVHFSHLVRGKAKPVRLAAVRLTRLKNPRTDMRVCGDASAWETMTSTLSFDPWASAALETSQGSSSSKGSSAARRARIMVP